jgi:hypothetical protein
MTPAILKPKCGINSINGTAHSVRRIWACAVNIHETISEIYFFYSHIIYNIFSFHNRNSFYFAFDVLRAVVMKSSIFWHITWCSPLKGNRSFGRKSRLPLQGWTISSPTKSLLATCFQALFLLGLFFDPEYGGDMFFPDTSVDIQLTILPPYSGLTPEFYASMAWIMQSSNLCK